MMKNVFLLLLGVFVSMGLSAADVWQNIADRTWITFDSNDLGQQIVFVNDADGNKKAIFQRYGSGCYVVSTLISDVSMDGDTIRLSGGKEGLSCMYLNDNDTTLMDKSGIRYRTSKLVIYDWLGNYCQGDTVSLEKARIMLSMHDKHERIRVSDDLELIKLSSSAYIHFSSADMPPYGRVGSNGLILVDHGSAFLFDTPVNDSLTSVLVSWMETQMGWRVVGFVPNHWHGDCMGGLHFLQSRNVKSYANIRTIKLAKKNHLPVPDMGFKKSLTLHLGEKSIECYYPGPAHSTDNIVVWIPSERILFAGCMVKSLSSTNLGNLADGDLKSYPKTLENVIDKFPLANYVIPGHGDVGGVELIYHTKTLINKK